MYLDILPEILKQYNNTNHSSIKITPTEASMKKNKGTVYFNLYGNLKQLSSKPKFKVGDKVRISKYKRKVFDKGYTPIFPEELFIIDKIQYTNPITYKLKDLNNKEIKGSFYEPEHHPECYCLSRHVLTAPSFSTHGIIISISRTSRL